MFNIIKLDLYDYEKETFSKDEDIYKSTDVYNHVIEHFSWE